MCDYFETLTREVAGDEHVLSKADKRENESSLTGIDISTPHIASNNDNATVVERFDGRIPSP